MIFLWGCKSPPSRIDPLDPARIKAFLIETQARPVHRLEPGDRPHLQYYENQLGQMWGSVFGPWDARSGEIEVWRAARQSRVEVVQSPHARAWWTRIHVDLREGTFGGLYENLGGKWLEISTEPPILVMELARREVEGKEESDLIDRVRIELKDQGEEAGPVAFTTVRLRRLNHRYFVVVDTNLDSGWRFKGGRPSLLAVNQLVLVVVPRGSRRSAILDLHGIHRVQGTPSNRKRFGLDVGGGRGGRRTSVHRHGETSEPLVHGYTSVEPQQSTIRPDGIGFYPSGIGLEPGNIGWLRVGASTEFAYKQERALDSLVHDALDDRFRVQRTREDFKRMLRPVRTTSSNTTLNLELAEHRSTPRLSLVFDRRRIVDEFNEFETLETRDLTSIGGQLLFNFGFRDALAAAQLGGRRVRVGSPDQGERGADQRRQELFTTLSLPILRNLEIYLETEHRQGVHFNSNFTERDLVFRGELRRRWFGGILIAGSSVATNRFDVEALRKTDDPVFRRTQTFVQLGLDANDRLSARARSEYVVARSTDPTQARQEGVEAQVLTSSLLGTLAVYRGFLFDFMTLNLDLGAEVSRAVRKLDDFDRRSLLAGVSLFAAGVVRLEILGRMDFYHRLDEKKYTVSLVLALFR